MKILENVSSKISLKYIMWSMKFVWNISNELKWVCWKKLYAVACSLKEIRQFFRWQTFRGSAHVSAPNRATDRVVRATMALHHYSHRYQPLFYYRFRRKFRQSPGTTQRPISSFIIHIEGWVGIRSTTEQRVILRQKTKRKIWYNVSFIWRSVFEKIDF